MSSIQAEDFSCLAPESGPAQGLRCNTTCLLPVVLVAGVARVQGEFYVVFDNSMALGHLDDRFRFRWNAVLSDPLGRVVIRT